MMCNGYLDPPKLPSTISQIPSIKGHKGSIRGYLGGPCDPKPKTPRYPKP